MDAENKRRELPFDFSGARGKRSSSCRAPLVFNKSLYRESTKNLFSTDLFSPDFFFELSQSSPVHWTPTDWTHGLDWPKLVLKPLWGFWGYFGPFEIVEFNPNLLEKRVCYILNIQM